MKVVSNILPLNRIADQIELSVAELPRDVECADGRNQDHGDAGNYAGQTQREYHPPQHTPAVAAQVSRSLFQLQIHFCHHRIDRKDHIRKIVVHHSDHHGAFGADHMQRPQPQRTQQAVQDSRILQNRHPGIGANQEVHPHRNHNQGDQNLLGPCRRTGEDIRHRVTHQQADDCRNHRQFQASPEDQQIGVGAVRRPCSKEPGHIFRCKAESIIRKGIIRHKDQRNDDKQQRPHPVGAEGRALHRR